MNARNIAFLLGAFILGALISTIIYSRLPGDGQKGVVGRFSVRSELAPIGMKAVLGDRDASAAMTRAMTTDCAYSAGGESFCKGSRELFAMIDAENGNPDGMIAYANILSESDYCVDLYRAKFWLRRVEDTGRKTLDRQMVVDNKLKNCG